MSRRSLTGVVSVTAFLSVALFFGAASSTRADPDVDVESITVGKSASWFQFGPNNFVEKPFFFEAFAEVVARNRGILSGRFMTPAGDVFELTPTDTGDFVYQATFQDLSVWQAAFTDGAYWFQLETATAPRDYINYVNLTQRYPEILPQILNSEWYSIVLQMNATKELTFKWNNFAGFSTSASQPSGVQFELINVFDQVIYRQRFDQPVTQISVPPNVMQPDNFYIGRVLFGHSDYEADQFTSFQSISAVATAFLISAVDGPPRIKGPLEVTITEGQFFAYVIDARNAPDSFGVSNLPTSLEFNGAFGVIAGYPTAGVKQWPISATNSLGTGGATLTLKVLPAQPLAITSSTTAAGAIGDPFRFQVLVPAATSAARLSATGLPLGLTADPVSGLISGTPTQSGSFRVTLTVQDGNAVATSELDLSFAADAKFPNITSAPTATVASGENFSYQIEAPGSQAGAGDPTTYSIIGDLPTGLSFDPKTGTISGTYGGKPATGGDPGDIRPLSGGTILGTVQLFANNSRGTATIPLVFLTPPVGAVNISTRMAVGTGENVLIGGFIITGNAPKKLILRGIGPSIKAGDAPLPGRLEDTVLEIYDDQRKLLTTNDDWKSTQQQEIVDTTVAPTDDRESAIVAAFEPGNYTAMVRGKNGATGIGLVEIFDLGTASLNSGSNAKLAQISTRGRVLTGDDIMIGGFIIAGSQTKVIARALGPSLAAQGVAGALEDTTLELRDANAALVAENDDWRTHQQQAIEDTTVPPTDDKESAVVETLNPGAYTAVVRGKNGTTGVALVEVFVLQ